MVDEAALARARRMAGLKGYVSNIPAGVMGADEVIASYHELWHVEQSFRMSKHDLRTRPIFHRTRDAIEAHLTVVMASLAVARHLQQATGMSIKRLVRELRPLQEVTINVNGHRLTAQPQLTETAQQILSNLGPGHWSAWRSSDCGFWWSQAACFRLFSSCSASLGVRYPSAEWSRV